jgi:hypothetical protein
MQTASVALQPEIPCVGQDVAGAIDPPPGKVQDASSALELDCKQSSPRMLAKRDIAAGQIIARVSKCMLLTSEAAAASPQVRRLLESGEPFAQEALLAVFLLDAGRRNGHLYFAGMWHGSAMDPLFLPASELDMLRGSYVVPALHACRAQFSSEHARLSVLLPEGGAGTLDDYLRARSAVMTHAQPIDTEQGQVLAMLPVPAMFSHGANACARWEDMPQEFVLRAQRAIRMGMRLPLANSGWARDEALAPLAALYDGEWNRKTDLVLPESAAGWPAPHAKELFGSQRDGKRVFRISGNHDDTSARQLLAYLRASSCLIVNTVDGEARADEALREFNAGGKTRPICRDSEVLAMQTLRAACQHQLQGFGSSIQDDERLLEQHASGSLQRSIAALRLQEKRILASYIDVVDSALPLLWKYDENSGTTFADYLRTAVANKPEEAEQTIFVSIASYRDPLLWNTVRECLSNAERPDLLRFGIVDQNDEDAGGDLARLPFAHQIRYVNIKPRDSRGACWARSIAFGLYDNEDYLLQIDSHMIFDPGWDRILKTQHKELSANNPKSILSCYPWAFEIENGEAVRKIISQGTLALRPLPNATLTEDSPVMLFYPTPQPMTTHYYAFELSGNFLFTLGSFADEIPYDPHLYFHGEEQNLTIRAYTHGWDMYHPRVIPLYHLYKKPERSEDDTPRHWDEKDNQSRQTTWWKLEEASKRRMCQLLYTNTIKGAYGLGSVRSLDDFAVYSGIDYRLRTVTPRDQVPVPDGQI